MLVLLQLILALVLGWMIFALVRIAAETRAAYGRSPLKQVQEQPQPAPRRTI
ncbi:MAG: hypothetical protein HC822_00940 [Oscillochloris sp.]|nr:hypothetical protein [Oscillochloris sp.]